MRKFADLKKYFSKTDNKAAVFTIGACLVLDVITTGGIGTATAVNFGLLSSQNFIEAIKKPLGSYISNFIQRFDDSAKIENHTNPILFTQASERCLKKVRENLANRNWRSINSSIAKSLGKEEKTFVTYIINPVFDKLKQDEFIEAVFQKNDQLRPTEFLKLAITDAVDFDDPRLRDLADKKEEIIKELNDSFQEHFVEQLRKEVAADPKLQASYHTFLMHGLVEGVNELKKHGAHNSLELGKLNAAIDLLNKTIDGGIDEFKEVQTNLKKNLEESIAFQKAFFENHNLPVLRDYTAKENYDNLSPEFSLQNSTFVGRNQEIDLLGQFLFDSSKKFSWFMISGPAGQGKSRLALHVCNQLREQYGWFTGFFHKPENSAAHFDWQRLKLNTSTLIVIDYVAARQEEVFQMLNTFRDLSKSICGKEHHLRVLLLEREFSDYFLNKKYGIKNHLFSYPSPENSLKGETTFESSSRIPLYDENLVQKTKNSNQSFVDYNNLLDLKEILVLKKLSKEILLEIVYEVAKKTSKEIICNPDEVWSLLKRLDKETTPLVAFILGIALGEDKNIFEWKDINAPLSYYLDREITSRWSLKPIWKENETLSRYFIFTTTISENLPWFALKNLPKILGVKDFLNLTPDNKIKLKNAYGSLLQHDSIDRNLRFYGLKPDLLGEYYILEHLFFVDKLPLDEEDIFKIWEEIISVCWFGNYLGFTKMLPLLKQNFGNHLNYRSFEEILVRLLDKLDLKENNQLIEKAKLYRILLEIEKTNNSKNENKVIINRFLDSLKKMYQSTPNTLKVKEQYALANAIAVK